MVKTRGRKKKKLSKVKGGNAVSTAAVPFGLFALSNFLSGKKKHKGTRKGMRRKTSRRAYMKKN